MSKVVDRREEIKRGFVALEDSNLAIGDDLAELARVDPLWFRLKGPGEWAGKCR